MASYYITQNIDLYTDIISTLNAAADMMFLCVVHYTLN